MNILLKIKKLSKSWFHHPDRIPLLRLSVTLFSIGALLTCLIGVRYFFIFQLPSESLAFVYTIAAFISHFGSIYIIVWTAAVAWIVLLVPVKKFIIPWSVFIIAVILSLTLLDSQLYSTHRFHFTFLTIKIFGIKTWGFGLLYMFICTIFMSFCVKLSWERVVVLKKSTFIKISLPLTLILLLFTHITHIWADATGYIPVTRFTATLPLFYPSTDSKRMKKLGFSSNSPPASFKIKNKNSDIFYPINPLTFSDSTLPNILFIVVDAMRSDVLNDSCAPQCMTFANDKATVYTRHYSGGNSTKMGSFSLFYGISPTYQQYIESNKISCLFIDRLIELKYAMGIFTSYRCDSPAKLDVTAFVNIPNLRIKTDLPGEHDPAKNDSAITNEFVSWLGKTTAKQPFFGFLFYDALCTRAFPEAYNSHVSYPDNATDSQKKFIRYKISMQYIDSLIGEILNTLTEYALLHSTIIVITADHGEEFDDNHLGINGHGSGFSEYQIRTPLVVYWPGNASSISTKRTSHNDITATLMRHGLCCKNPLSDFSSGYDLFSDTQWDWLIVGSYYNFAIVEPKQITIQFPGGYYQVRDYQYRIVPHPSYSENLGTALLEMGRFYRK